MKDVYSKATRNCPWVEELWGRYVSCLERGHASEKEIYTVFEKSLHSTFSTLEEYLDLFLAQVDGFRRKFSSARGDDMSNHSLIRDFFWQVAVYLELEVRATI